jgi:hypothetical protein
MNELRTIWRQLSTSFGLVVALVVAAIVVVAVLLVFGFVAVWIAVIYLAFVCYLAIRRFLRRHFAPLAGTAERESPFEPSSASSPFSRPFAREDQFGSAGEKDVQTIDVTAENVEYVDPPMLEDDKD